MPIPAEEWSPTVCQIYQDAVTSKEEVPKLMMQSLPILSLLSYLVINGASIQRSNKAGKTIPVRDSSGGISCMGRRDCNQPPVHLLSCPHKPACKFCYNCFLLFSSKIKCGCADEDVEPIPSSVGSTHPWDLSSDREEESLEFEVIEPDLLSYDSSLVQDGAFGVDRKECPPIIQLQLFHDHPDVLKRKLTDEEKKTEGFSSPKKGRRNMAD